MTVYNRGGGVPRDAERFTGYTKKKVGMKISK